MVDPRAAPAAQAVAAAEPSPSLSGAATEAGAVSTNEALVTELANTLNSTLDLDALLERVAELVSRVINFEIFSILLLNERTQQMRMRFQLGHSPEVAERLRISVGHGVTGQAAERREAVLVNDVSLEPNYIAAHPAVRSELAVPLITKGRVIGVIDIQASQLDYFTPEHGRLLSVVASRIAVAVENARLYSRVARQAQTLTVLNEISRDLTSILDLDQLLQRIGDLLLKLLDYQMFSILLLDDSGKTLQHRFSLRFKESIQLKHDIPLGEGLVGEAALHRRSVLVPDVTKDRRYIKLNPETRSELCLPLIYKDKVIGVLDLEHTRRGYFNEDHVRTMSTLAAQIAVAIENARLYERIARQEALLERDLAMAREVQFHLLPPCCPTLPGAELAVRFAPAHVIGGDIYDFMDYSGHRTAIAVGDVSGKGAPAALYAALVGGILRSNAVQEPSPAEMLHLLNAALHHRRLDAQFVSVVFAVYDHEQRTLHLANSGLPRPILWRRGKVSNIDSTGLPIGLFPDSQYEETTITAQAGDVFLFFSDGLLDATNAAGDLFGRNRLEHFLAMNSCRSAEDLVESITQAIAGFSQGVAAFDDQTIVVLRITGDGPVPARPRRTSSALRKHS